MLICALGIKLGFFGAVDRSSDSTSKAGASNNWAVQHVVNAKASKGGFKGFEGEDERASNVEDCG